MIFWGNFTLYARPKHACEMKGKMKLLDTRSSGCSAPLLLAPAEGWGPLDTSNSEICPLVMILSTVAE